MLMQMIPAADAIGQTECEAARAIGARTFVTPVVFNVNDHHWMVQRQPCNLAVPIS